MGTWGSASVFVPHVTGQYTGPKSDVREEAATYPVCTVRHFPSRTEHTVVVGASQQPSPPQPPTWLSLQLHACAPPDPWLLPLPHSGPGSSLRSSLVQLLRVPTTNSRECPSAGRRKPSKHTAGVSGFLLSPGWTLSGHRSCRQC